MTQPIERRKAERRSDEEDVSPEYLELLEVCGGEIRAHDRAILAERRKESAPGATAVAGTVSAEPIARAVSRLPATVEAGTSHPAPSTADRRARSG